MDESGGGSVTAGVHANIEVKLSPLFSGRISPMNRFLGRKKTGINNVVIRLLGIGKKPKTQAENFWIESDERVTLIEDYYWENFSGIQKLTSLQPKHSGFSLPVLPACKSACAAQEQS